MAEEAKKNASKVTTYVLIGLLLVAAFFLGSFATQIKSLKKDEGTPQAQETETQPAQEGAQERPGEKILTAEERAEIENSGISKGNADASVTIVEFSEYECPFCQRYIEGAYAQIWTEYGDQIRYIFHDYPLPFHQNAQETAEAARCAGEQDDYWGYHDLLFANRDDWAEETDPTDVLEGFASDLGLDSGQFSDCLSSGKYAQAVKDDLALGQKVGVSGTPSFFINGRPLVGAQPFEAFKAIIDEELAR